LISNFTSVLSFRDSLRRTNSHTTSTHTFRKCFSKTGKCISKLNNKADDDEVQATKSTADSVASRPRSSSTVSHRSTVSVLKQPVQL
uniref:Ovule protein n=1 Tax=Syphacia muris TaxID=451379 RepID=A0A0N5ACY1_9BILA